MTHRSAFDLEDRGQLALSLREAAVLVVVVIGSVALRQYGWAGESTGRWDSRSDANIIIDGLHKARHLLNAATPIGFGLAVAAFARMLREPLPRRKHLFLQPGGAACVALVAALLAGAANSAAWAVRRFEFHEPWLAGSSTTNILFSSAQSHLTFCVLAVWAFLAFSGLWTRGRNWINRLGITLGILAVVHSLLWCLP